MILILKFNMPEIIKIGETTRKVHVFQGIDLEKTCGRRDKLTDMHKPAQIFLMEAGCKRRRKNQKICMWVSSPKSTRCFAINQKGFPCGSPPRFYLRLALRAMKALEGKMELWVHSKAGKKAALENHTDWKPKVWTEPRISSTVLSLSVSLR